jgi:hypothetical protein
MIFRHCSAQIEGVPALVLKALAKSTRRHSRTLDTRPASSTVTNRGNRNAPVAVTVPTAVRL